MPATTGKRRPELLAPRGEEEGDIVLGYVVGPKPLRFGEHILPPGTEVPGAKEWTRIESWVNSRTVLPVREGVPYTTFETFLENKEHAQRVYEVAGIPIPEDDELEE